MYKLIVWYGHEGAVKEDTYFVFFLGRKRVN